MKKFKLIFLIFFIFIYSNTSFSQIIAFADMDKIIKTSIVGKKIIIHFKKKNETLLNELDDKRKTIKDKENKIIAQKNILENDVYLKKINEIKIEVDEFNDQHKKKITKLNIEKDKVSKSFQIEINKILKEFAENNKIDIILSSNQMLIGKSNFDVTEQLLNIVNDKIKNFKLN